MTTTTTQMGSEVSTSEVAIPINYRPFRSAARQYINGKITRERLVFDWREAQKEQGIRAVQLKRI